MKLVVTQQLQKASTLKGWLSVQNRTIVMLVVSLVMSISVFAQNSIRVKGRVTDDLGLPLAKASITVKGAAGGVSSDENGNFEIDAPPNGTLVITTVGFFAKEVKVSNQPSISVSLTPSNRELEQVVVVGYGAQKKRDVTGSTVSVSESALREVPVANLQQALQGRAAGLEVQRVGNQPGSGGQIRIRGNRSISGSNEPLVVVDGIQWEGNLNDINPDDIASVDILKDASATAVYGSRGSNGVILITTKKGRGGPTKVSYNGYYGIGNVANSYPVFNADEYRTMRDISTWGAGYMPEELNGIALGRNTDWQDAMYQSSHRTDHNISVSGGSDGNNFSLGGGYYNETTVLPGESFTRYSVRASIDSRIGRRFKVGLTTLNTVSITEGSQFVSGSPLFRMLALSPLMPTHNVDGSVYLMPWGNIDDNNAADRYSPLILKENNNDWVDRVRRLRTFNTLYAEVQIIEGLRYRANLGLNYAQQHAAQFQATDQPPLDPSFFRSARGNIARVDNGETWGYTFDNLLYYDKTIKEKHKINFTGLYSIQESQSFNNFVQKDSIDDDMVQFYNLGQSTAVNSANTSLGGGESRWALISYMARVNYAFDGKYLLSVTYRRDGSSRLAEGNKWFDYAGVSGGWVISDEDFMRDFSFINSLKLRGGWGKTSNQSIDPYQSLGLVNNSNGLGAGSTGGNILRYNYGPTVVTGYNVVTLPNPNLSWEFTKATNIGIDFGILNNKITGSMEFYNAITDRILYNVTLPVTSGVAGAYTTNIGEMENKGFEFSANANLYTSKSGFNWSMDLNLFFNKNEIRKLSNDITMDIGNQLFVGHPMSAIYDYNKQGIWQSSDATAAAQFNSLPGQIRLEDRSGPAGKPDGLIHQDHDRYVIGDGDADLQGGMAQRFTFKGFDLSAVFYARFGGTLISQIHQPIAGYLTVMDGRRNGLKVDYWTPTNPSNWFPMPQQTISPVSTAWTTLGYHDASFVKLRSVNLGYTFSQSLLKHISAQSLRLYFTVDNVAILFSPYYNETGIDPEGTGVGNQGVSNPGNIRNNNRGNGTITIGLGTPPRTTFTFGANITL
jgi:TonB-dependent starch-binding outer membrane protein SusC